MLTLLSEDNYRLFFENALNAIAFHEIVLDGEGKPVDYVFLRVNPAFELMTGLKAADIQGKRVREVVPGIENDPADWIGIYGKVALEGEELRREEHSALLNKWFRIVAFQTSPGQFCTFFDDITGNKHTEEEMRRTAAELEKEREVLQTIYDSIPVMLAIWDPGVQVLKLNKAFDRIVGWTQEDHLEKDIMELVYPDPEYRRWVSDYMNSLEMGFRDIKMVTKSGDVLETSWANIPISDGRNLGIGIDVTERKKAHMAVIRANEVLNEKNSELEKMHRLHESLLYIIAHDLKAPVANMKLAVEVLKEISDPEIQKEVFHSFQELILQQDRILNGLIEVIEVQSIREIKLENIRLEEFVGEIIKDHEELLTGRKGKISSDFQDAPVVRYNPSFLRSIFINLITNSIKYADKCRDLQIKIGSCLDNGSVLITFRDNGIGIDLVKYGKKLFQPFQRFSVQSDGTGIGLYILKSLVEKNGGRVKVESEPGKGTTFYCHL